MTHRQIASLVVTGWLLGGLACGGPAWAIPTTEPAPEHRMEVPRPDLAAMQRPARRKIEELQTTLEERLRRPSASPAEISEAFGVLGQAFHAFQLYDAAITCYSQAHTLSTGDLRWLYYRALAYNSRGDLEKATSDYLASLDLQPDLLPARIRLGNVHLELGHLDAAERAFLSALDQQPEMAVAHFGLGRVELERGNARDAVRQLDKALALEPAANSIHYSLAQAHRQLGDIEVARRQLELRGDDEPKIPDPLAFQITLIGKGAAFEVLLDMAAQAEGFSEDSFLGFAMAQFANVPGASDQLAAALQQNQQLAATARGRLHYAIGGLLAAQGRDGAAVTHLEQALEQAPELVDARLVLANALARGRRFDEAATRFDEVLAAAPRQPAALAQRAAVRSNLGDLDGARADLETLMELEPRNREAHFRLAAILERQGDLDAAADRYGRTIALGATPQEKAASVLEIASLYRRHDDFRSAVDLYQKALAIDAESWPALSELGSLLAQLGHYPEAAKVYARMLELEPLSAAARIGQASALILAGEHRAARDQLEQGLALLPQSLDLKDVLARHLAASPDRAVRDGARAVELARQLYDAVKSPESLETLAMAHAQAGAFNEAVSWQEKLLAENTEATPAVRQRWQKNLELYRGGEACCWEE